MPVDLQVLQKRQARQRSILSEHPGWTPKQAEQLLTFTEAVEDLIPFLGKEVPDLGNKGPAELVDLAGRQNELRKAVEKVEKLLKGIIDTKLTEEVITGDFYTLTNAPTETTRLDQGFAQRKLAELGVPEGDYMVTTEGTRKTFTKNT